MLMMMLLGRTFLLYPRRYMIVYHLRRSWIFQPRTEQEPVIYVHMPTLCRLPSRTAMILYVSVPPWRLLPLQHEQERTVYDCRPTVMVIVLFSQSCCCTLAKPWLHLRRVSGRIRLAAPVVVVPSLILK